MSDHTNKKTIDGFTLKLWRGERMVLIGMNLEDPEPDFVGFSIEVKSPNSNSFQPLRNRLNFNYDKNKQGDAVTGARTFPSLTAPIQKFRWIHFPFEPQDGRYEYRVTKIHMSKNQKLKGSTTITLDINMDREIYHDFLELGFGRNYASSQKYIEKYKNSSSFLPENQKDGLSFQKVQGDVYEWLGFEAYRLILEFLNTTVDDESIELDCFAYDLNEPDIVDKLAAIGPRLRIIIDDSKDHLDGSAESMAAEKLLNSGATVKRMHFDGLQHNKVLIAKKNGNAIKVLFGSTNFSFRGLYIQANNVLVFHDASASRMFESVFQSALISDDKFQSNPLAKQWFLLTNNKNVPIHFCFSPHSDPSLSLGPIASAIDQATSSVLFCIAFLNQAKSGPVRGAVDRIADKSIFSYGISNHNKGLNVIKPDGSLGIVDFKYLHTHTPAPFKSEWFGGKGIQEHHKFVVTDFNLPTAKVFTGSCNMSISGEKKNGDNLVMIEDTRIATSFAIESLRIFDHLHFRTKMEDSTNSNIPKTLELTKPTFLSGNPAWYAKYYIAGSQNESDRKLFAT